MSRAPKPPKIKLIVSHGSAWGPGKVHAEEDGNPEFGICGSHVYGEHVKGTSADITCKRCIRRYWRGPARGR